MSQTISKHIGEGFGKGELYAALAYDAADSFGGMKIKNVMFNEDGKAYFYDEDMYIGASADGALVIASDTSITLEAPTVNVSVTASSAFTDPVTITITDPAAPVNGLYSLINDSTAYTTGNIVAGRFKTSCTVATGTVYDMTGVWAGLTWSLAFAAAGAGLSCAINAEVVTACAAAKGHPNAILYLQSLPGTGASHATMPYIVFSETVVGTGSNILFEVGHAPAATVPTIGDGLLFYHNTLQIGVNESAGVKTAWYIPLSSAQGSFTTAYPIVTTYATTAIDISTCTTGIDITAAATGINLNGAMTTGISMAGGSTYIPIQIGVKSADNVTPGEGMKLAGLTDNSGGIQIYCDDGGVAAVGEVISPFRSRYLLTANQSGGVSQTALFAQLVSGGSGTRTYTTGAFRAAYVFNQQGTTTLVTSAECLGINQATTLAGTMTVGSGCTFAGIDINIAGAGAIINNGTAAALLIRASGTPVWTNGIQIATSGAATGIDIGTVTSYAINFSGDEGRILMGASTSSRASFAATGDVAQFFTVNMAETGICTGLDFEHSLGFQGNTAMQATAIRGVLRILTGATINGTSKIYEGAAGYFMNEGTVNSASIDVTGVRGVIMDGGVWTAARNVACGWFDWQLNNALAGITNTSILLLTNNANQGAENPDNVMYLFTPYMKYLLNFQDGSATGGEIIAAGGSGGATRSYKIKCKYADTEFYLSGYTD